MLYTQSGTFEIYNTHGLLQFNDDKNKPFVFVPKQTSEY